MTKFAFLIVLILAICLGYKYLDAYSRIEAGTINEIFISGERDFLMRLPAIMKDTPGRNQLLIRLQNQFPDFAVREIEHDICVGRLRLKFATSTELVDIIEGCD